MIADFEIDPYYILQGISLASRKAPSCKRSEVLNMAASDITDWWDKVVPDWQPVLKSCATIAR